MTVNLVDFYTQPPFRQVCDMEDHLATIDDLLLGILYMSAELDNDQGKIISRLAGICQEKYKKAEELRCELFRLTHPNRQHFEKEGWPADKIEDATA